MSRLLAGRPMPGPATAELIEPRWTESYLRWVATDLIHDAVREALITHRLKALYRELMKIRITEPVFFEGVQRHAGDEIDVKVGPFRTEVVPGGLKRIPQFVEMAEEIKQTAAAEHPAQPLQPAPPVAPQQEGPPNGSFAEATAAVLKPASKPAPSPESATIKMLAALTARRKKLHQDTQDKIKAFAARLTEQEAAMPKVFDRANTKLDDEIAGTSDFDDSLKDFAGANGIPLDG